MPNLFDRRRDNAMLAACWSSAAMINTLKAAEGHGRGVALAALKLAVETLEPQLDKAELEVALETIQEHGVRCREHIRGLSQS